MADERTDVEIALAKEGRLLKKLTRLHEEQTLLYQQNIHDTFYEKALEFESASEKLTLNARTIPVATGRPSAQMDVELIMEKEIPVEMGFTEQGWFQLRMPMILPQKGKGGSQYIRGFLYPAMMRFMRNDQRALRYKECILIYRHVYSRTYDERKYRDHDNIELNMVTDTVAVRVMADDSPMLCRHYYCSAVGDNERTEVYVIPRSDFFKWLEMEDHIPESGLKVEKTPSIFGQ